MINGQRWCNPSPLANFELSGTDYYYYCFCFCGRQGKKAFVFKIYSDEKRFRFATQKKLTSTATVGARGAGRMNRKGERVESQKKFIANQNDGSEYIEL